MKKIILSLLSIFFLFSCNEYQKAIKSEDVAVKMQVAEKMYTAGKYDKALALFEMIAPAYKGKASAERLFYMMSQSYFKTKQYSLSGYQFENFSVSFPKSEKVEEAAFLGAKSYSMLSPIYSLDQVDTEKAISKVQNFIDQYPNSTYLPQANEIMVDMKGRIEKKVFENAKQYHTISDFKSAQVAFENFISDFPGTPYKEDALFLKFDSAYLLAVNSVQYKMKERLETAKTAYSGLVKYKPESKYKAKADKMIAKIDEDLKQFYK